MKLITGGCSFSECISTHIDTWPRHLARSLDCEHISTGLGSQGNGLISRKVIYQVSKALKETPSKELLVGIMWSGPDRHDFYSEESIGTAQDGWMENPTSVAQDKLWTILNYQWTSPHSKVYYEMFFDRVGHHVYTLEHILRTQWFLKLHNVRYFMSTYTGITLPDFLRDHDETKHLYEQLDFENFLPIIGEYEWCRDASGLPFPDPNDKHPGTAQHKAFAEKVILPFLEKTKG